MDRKFPLFRVRWGVGGRAPTAKNQVIRKSPLRKHDFLDEFLGYGNPKTALDTSPEYFI